jgi:hypothetical protein
MAIYQEKTKMTQRPLTAAEQELARTAYQANGKCYSFTNSASELVQACCFLTGVIQHNTTDGKPLRTERAPTKEDIGRWVKVKSAFDAQWYGNYRFVGFCHGPRFVVENMMSRQISDWQYCIIDEEGGQ